MLRENPYAEWYLNSMQITGSPTQLHHERVYGAETPYDDFVAAFDGASSGARLDTLASLSPGRGCPLRRAHDEAPRRLRAWPSRVRHPVKGASGGRDLVGELGDAVRSRRMRMGLYYSGGYDWPYNGAVLRRAADVVLGRALRPRLSRIRDGPRARAHRSLPAVSAVERHLLAARWEPRRALRALLQHGRGRGRQRSLARTEAAAPRRVPDHAPSRWRPDSAPVARDPAAPEAADLRLAPPLGLPDPRVRGAPPRDGAQVGARPRRRPLLRSQPARATRGHHHRHRADPVVLRRRLEEREPAHRGGPTTRRQHPRVAAGTLARARRLALGQRRGRLRQPALGRGGVDDAGGRAGALHVPRGGRVRPRHRHAENEAYLAAGRRQLRSDTGAPAWVTPNPSSGSSTTACSRRSCRSGSRRPR